MAAGILRAIQDNAKWFNFGVYAYPFQWEGAGEYYRATFISFGIALGAGALVGAFILCITGQTTRDYFEDIAYWIVRDDGLRPPRGEVREENEIKGVHSYVGGN